MKRMDQDEALARYCERNFIIMVYGLLLRQLSNELKCQMTSAAFVVRNIIVEIVNKWKLS